MASTRLVEEDRGTYTGQIRPHHNGYWAGDFSAAALATSGATRPVPRRTFGNRTRSVALDLLVSAQVVVMLDTTGGPGPLVASSGSRG